MDTYQYKVKKLQKLYQSASCQNSFKTPIFNISEKKQKSKLVSNRYIQQQSSEIRLENKNNKSTDSVRIHTLKKSVIQQERRNRLFTLQYDEDEEKQEKLGSNIKASFLIRLFELKKELDQIHGSDIYSYKLSEQSKIYSKKDPVKKMKQASLKIITKFLLKKFNYFQVIGFRNIQAFPLI